MSDPWTQGYACAVALLQKLDGGKLLTTDVKEIMRSGGLTKRVCEKAGVDEYDMALLFPARIGEANAKE